MTDTSSLLSTGALLGAGGAILYQLKGIPTFLYKKVKRRIVYTASVYQYDDLFNHLEKWLAKNHQSLYRDVEAITYFDIPLTPNTPESNQVITYKQEDNTFLLKYRGKKILISKSKEKVEKQGMSLKDMFFRKYTLSGIKAKSQINALLQEALDLSLSEIQPNTLKVYFITSFGEWNYSSDAKVKPLEKIVLPPNAMHIVEDVQNFLKSEEWYNLVCIPYKRGYAFYGPPGTGKSTLALALGNLTKRNVYCLNLNALDNDSRLPQAFSSIRDNSILLIEDIDKIFSGRDSVSDCKVSFSSFLNCLDGAFHKHGLITIITTNHLDKLDPALLRTGRIDIKLEIGKPTQKEISQYLTLFYEEPTEINGTFALSMSDIQEICILNRDSRENAILQIQNKQLTNGKLQQHLREYNLASE